jgi:hypothetical protein
MAATCFGYKAAITRLYTSDIRHIKGYYIYMQSILYTGGSRQLVWAIVSFEEVSQCSVSFYISDILCIPHTVYCLYQNTKYTAHIRCCISSPPQNIWSPTQVANYHQPIISTSIKILTFIFKIIRPKCLILYNTVYTLNGFLCVTVIYTYIHKAEILYTNHCNYM